MDFRKVFNDKVDPAFFDKFRFRYCDALFEDLIAFCALDDTKSVLEIGPGTGQATEPILKSGCSYLAIELGESFAQDMKRKFGTYKNFDLVQADFETYAFEEVSFDLVYSAATIQWIPEEIAFSKTYRMLKRGGTLAMFMTHTDYKTPNEALYNRIQAAYDQFFKPEKHYALQFDYQNAVNYGFVDFERREYPQWVEYTADEYVSFISIHADHLTLPEPYRTGFFNSVREAIKEFGGKITLKNTIVLYLTRKP